MWLDFTNLSLAAAVDAERIFAKVTSLADGSPISGIEISTEPSADRSGTVQTDSAGCATLVLPPTDSFILRASDAIGSEKVSIPVTDPNPREHDLRVLLSFVQRELCSLPIHHVTPSKRWVGRRGLLLRKAFAVSPVSPELVRTLSLHRYIDPRHKTNDHSVKSNKMHG